MGETTTDAPEGRRERKRRQTRERIVAAALSLFLEQGYDATTMDAIADAADVSRRSLFDYFPAKEDVLFARQEEFRAAVAAQMRRRPADEPWPVLVEQAMVHAIADAASPQNIAIDALVRRTPALQSRHQLKYVHLEEVMADALTDRGDGSEATRRRAELLAAVVVAGFRVATRSSAGLQAGDDPRQSVPKAFRSFWASLCELGEQGLAVRARQQSPGRPPGAPRRKGGREP